MLYFKIKWNNNIQKGVALKGAWPDNFRSVFILVVHPKLKNTQICILFWSSRRKWRLSNLLFYWKWSPHFVNNYLTRFDHFFANTQFGTPSECEREKYEPSVGTKILKKVMVSRVVKKVIWSSTFKIIVNNNFKFVS